MPSFTERYHTLTKYNPTTIDKLESVHWGEQPSPFKPLAKGDKISLKGFLHITNDPESGDALVDFTKNSEYIDLHTLAHLLYFTCGITSVMPQVK